MGDQIAERRAKKALKRKSKLTRRSAKRAIERPAHRWDALFGRGVRFAFSKLEGRSDADIVEHLTRGRLADGRRVLKAFLDEGGVAPDEVDTVRSWTAVKASLYECLALRGTVVELLDLVTWETRKAELVHPVAAAAFEDVRYGAAVLLPTPEGWVLGGEVQGVRANATRRDCLRVAGHFGRQHPRLCQRAHPDEVERMLVREHALFLAHFQAPWVNLPGEQIHGALAGFHAPSTPVDGFVAVRRVYFETGRPLGLFHDLAWGLVIQPDLADLVAALERSDVDEVVRWMRDPAVHAACFTLAQRLHPDVTGGALTEVLGSSGDLAALTAAVRPAYARTLPSILPVPVEVFEALQDAPMPSDGIGMNALLGMEF